MAEIDNERIMALGQMLALTTDEMETELQVSKHDDKTIEYGREEYLVVTDEEADELWEESLDSYLEDCIYPELPENMRHYFDDEKWKRDARMDGRAHSLNHYDGNELSEEVEGTEYYIYRQN